MHPGIRAGGLAAMVLVAVGCSDAPSVSSSTEEADVKGTVRVLGKAVNNGEVLFHSANIQRATKDRSAQIKKDGTYELKAYVGSNYVSVNCKELNSNKTRKLRDKEESVTIESGSNTVDLSFP